MNSERIAVNPQSVTLVVSRGGFWSRLAIACELGHKKTSHVIAQIELAVALGYIKRTVGTDRGVNCLLYTVEPGLFNE